MVRQEAFLGLKRLAPAGVLQVVAAAVDGSVCLLYTSPSPRDILVSRMPSSA